MKLLIINEVCGHTSTGKICAKIGDSYISKGWDVKIAYGRDGYVPDKYKEYAVRIGNDLDVRVAALQVRLLDNAGLANVKATKNFLKWMDNYKPDMIWLHNLHGYYINIKLLFEWLKKHPKIEKRWTLHDCWAFTGHCTYFEMVNCERWKTQCYGCIQKNRYPKSYLLDRSKVNYKKKKGIFTKVENLVIYTPSGWLANLVKESFLGEYSVEVHYNLIDKSVFKPTPSEFRNKYSLINKKIILGVANIWDERKGLNDFIQLANQILSNEVIVLVGLTKAQIERLPTNIIGIEKTKNAVELAEIYSAADVFFNPTYEDNYPTVNLEAEACGLPVITYDTGGCRETISDIRSKVISKGIKYFLDAYNENFDGKN